jgi:hypothetical protein
LKMANLRPIRRMHAKSRKRLAQHRITSMAMVRGQDRPNIAEGP